MTDECPIVNRNGLFIPEPIIVAMINMKHEDIGRMVYYMLEWTHDLGICASNEEEMSHEANLICDIWKELFRERTDNAD